MAIVRGHLEPIGNFSFSVVLRKDGYWKSYQAVNKSFLPFPTTKLQLSVFKMSCLPQIKGKIRIGYVLKSAEVRTLVSNRYSEDSSRIHPRISIHTCAYLCTPMYTCIHLNTPTQTRAHLHIPKHTCAHQHTSGYTCTHPCTPAYTCAHLCAPAHSCAHLCTPALT